MINIYDTTLPCQLRHTLTQIHQTNKKLVHDFVFVHIPYCNNFFYSTIMRLLFNITINHYVFLLLLVLFHSNKNSIIMVLCSDLSFYPEERDALLLIRDSLTSSDVNLHENWTGPPCIENQSTWFGITCSNWHVVHIFLEGINLSGSLPPTFLQNITFLTQISFRNNLLFGVLPNLTNLVSLEQVIFSNNHFSGSIPLEYVDVPSLRVLEVQENYLDGKVPPFDQPSLESFNVSYNHLGGKIPETFVLQRFPKSSFDNNSGLCGKPLDELCPSQPPPAPSPAPFPTPPPIIPKHKKRLKVWIIAFISASSSVILLLIIVALLFWRKRASAKGTIRSAPIGYLFGAWAKKMVSYSLKNEGSERLGRLEFSNKKFQVFDLDDLLRASSEVLGRGNLGITYKATLEIGTAVAVKRLSYMDEVSNKEFLHHMNFLGNMKHENLVEIMCFYYSEEQKLVIYELMSDGTLFELLHEGRGIGRMPLDWTTRLAIIKDIAKGLEFLHHSLSSHKVPHANLKSSNVLIHQDSRGYHSKLTDYGFLPLLTSKKNAEKLSISKSPEFVKGKKLTHKTDVYCFGILMLEIITGKVPGQITAEIEGTTCDLSNWVRTVVNNDWSTDIFDLEILAEKEGHDAMLKLTELALECTDLAPEKRPKMSAVLRRIEEIEQMKRESD